MNRILALGAAALLGACASGGSNPQPPPSQAAPAPQAPVPAEIASYCDQVARGAEQKAIERDQGIPFKERMLFAPQGEVRTPAAMQSEIEGSARLAYRTPEWSPATINAETYLSCESRQMGTLTFGRAAYYRAYAQQCQKEGLATAAAIRACMLRKAEAGKADIENFPINPGR